MQGQDIQSNEPASIEDGRVFQQLSFYVSSLPKTPESLHCLPSIYNFLDTNVALSTTREH